jgi:Tol biopolymer transport system component
MTLARTWNRFSRARWFAFGTVVAVAVGCSASWARSDGIEPVRPDGPVPQAERSTLRGRVAYSLRTGIWVMNADGSHRRRLTRPGRGIDFDPSLSPDAKAVVFRTSRGKYLPDRFGIGLEGIFVVDVRTRRERPIHPPQGGLFPAWSPDGTVIAFSTLRQQGGETIHLATPTGRNLRDLTGTSFRGVQEGLAWSPDSRRIAYSGHNGDGNWAVWIMNRDGSGKRQLTHPALVEPRGSGGDQIGAWSPDGRQLVYSSGQFRNRELYVINADGTGRYQLTDWPGADGAVAWLPSGEIVFAHFTGDEPLPKWYLVKRDGSGLRSLPWIKAGDPLDWVQPR